MTAPLPSSQQHEPTFIGVHHVHSEIPHGTVTCDGLRRPTVASLHGHTSRRRTHGLGQHDDA